jgi:hypothetical protein
MPARRASFRGLPAALGHLASGGHRRGHAGPHHRPGGRRDSPVTGLGGFCPLYLAIGPVAAGSSRNACRARYRYTQWGIFPSVRALSKPGPTEAEAPHVQSCRLRPLQEDHLDRLRRTRRPGASQRPQGGAMQLPLSGGQGSSGRPGAVWPLATQVSHGEERLMSAVTSASPGAAQHNHWVRLFTTRPARGAAGRRSTGCSASAAEPAQRTIPASGARKAHITEGEPVMQEEIQPLGGRVLAGSWRRSPSPRAARSFPTRPGRSQSAPRSSRCRRGDDQGSAR